MIIRSLTVSDKHTMEKITIQDLLPFVNRPSQYLGTETNRFLKDPAKIEVRVALAFPDLYEIGTSHFGMQILYHILNQRPDVAAERVFAPGEDMAANLVRSSMLLTSLESKTPLNRFDIVGFSLLYELNYTNVLSILDLGGIPFLSKQRGAGDPFVIAGGPCTCNPEPVADFFDAVVIGDGEEVALEMVDAWKNWRADGDGSRQTLLETWSGLQGVYVPGMYAPRYHRSGFQSLEAIKSGSYPVPAMVRRRILKSLDEAPFPDRPVVPFGRPVHDRLRVEIARGCSRGCRFCQAGMIYRPVRERAPETVLALSGSGLRATGYEDISLLSLSTGDYQSISQLMVQMMAFCEPGNVAISLPSLRAGTLTPHLMNQIKRVRKTGFTIAPEAGSQALRNQINKNLTDHDIEETVKQAFSLGWQVIKLYFMVGLPHETDSDIDAMIRLVNNVKKLSKSVAGRKGRSGKLNVSVATFIPKPHTPFQWAPQIQLSEATDRIARIKDRLRVPGIQVKWQNPKVSILEGLWSRGDRRLAKLLINAYQKGCRFDGWSDRFRYRNWISAIDESGIDLDFFTTRERDTTEPLPWDHIDIGVDKSYLIEEWFKAGSGALTPDCRTNGCQGCGVCDFETIQPRVFDERGQNHPEKGDQYRLKGAVSQPAAGKYRISYSKMGDARYLGHLELANILSRALRRAGFPLKYSEGFHPKPKISFEDPLPVGIESEQERFYITTTDAISSQKVLKQLSLQLPDGLTITGCRRVNPQKPDPQPEEMSYRIESQEPVFDADKLEQYRRSTACLIFREDRKGKLKKIDLKDMVQQIEITSANRITVRIANRPGRSIRPFEVMEKIFNLNDNQIKKTRVIKQGG